jgi:hypothetical protein
MHFRNALLLLGGVAVLIGWHWLDQYVAAADDDPGLRQEQAQEPTIPISLKPSAPRPISAGPLPTRDARLEALGPPKRSEGLPREAALLQQRVADVKIERDPISGSARWIASPSALLTDPAAAGAADAKTVVRSFLEAHAAVIGHGPEVLKQAREVSDDRDARTGARKLIWHQQLDGIDVFEATLQGSVGANGALINFGSQMIPAAAAAAGGAGREAILENPPVAAAEAVAAAGAEIGDRIRAASVRPVEAPAPTPERRQRFRAALLTDADARLIWVPINANTLRLAWDVTLTSRARAEMYRVLVDAASGAVLVRHALTSYLSDATYRVFTTESPTPLSPGHAAPSSLQPAAVPRALVTTPALNTTASPAGWINDGVTLTSGNNVDAYADANADNVPDLPRVQSGADRVFDFPLDLSQAPSSYKSASVTQLFYWTNFAHDRLYDLGFTEAAGNFQVNNFGRGGAGNDPVNAESQDGGGINNANFSTPIDGSRGRLQMFLWTDGNPDRDGSFDAEVVLHEYCHGLSNRLVGGPSVTISALTSQGLGEGWSDFFSMALTAETADDPHANWARAGYSKYQAGGWYTENYYFGTRRYSYSTDLRKNPLTFKDIDPKKVDWHVDVPRNPTFPPTQDATQVHHQGTVWCTMLWEMRANLILKHGFGIGNDRAMFLVTQGMKFTPANPNFVQARDGIVQAALVHHPEDLGEIWTAFAKRGLGQGATAPASSTTTGVTESFTVPDALALDDLSGWAIAGEAGGVFAPSTKAVRLQNTSASAVSWSAAPYASWLSASPAQGIIAPGETAMVVLSVHADNLPAGFHSTNVSFLNRNSGLSQALAVRLEAAPPVVYRYELDSDPGWLRTGDWAFGSPSGGGGSTVSKPDPKTGATGTRVFGTNLTGNVSTTLTGPHYLTMGPLDLCEVRGTRLRFMRWLNANAITNCRATVEVSNDGSNWQEVFVNPAAPITETAWHPFWYDIATVADGQSRVFVRWGYSNILSPGAFSGWNIDDVEILGEVKGAVAVELPGSISEAAGAVTGRVVLAKAVTEPVTISLHVSDPSLAAITQTVAFGAGESVKEFQLFPVNTAAIEGSRAVKVTAAVPGMASRTAAIVIIDDETAGILLSVDAVGIEGSAVAGAVALSRAPARDLSVSLLSEDAGLLLPPEVVIPAGTTGPVPFECQLTDNNRVEGTRTVRVTAMVTGWSAATALIQIADDDVPALSMDGISRVREGDPAQPMTLRLNLPSTVNTVVRLFSSDATQLTVPASVTIPAGQSEAKFSATVVNDTALDGARQINIIAKATGYADGTHVIRVEDNEVDHYTFDPIASPQRIKRPMTVRITARDIGGEIVTNHSGTLTLKAVSPNGPVPVTLGRLSAFSNGSATCTVAPSVSVPSMMITASDARARRGVSNSFSVEPGAHAAFSWSGLPTVAVTQDVPFNGTLTALDDSGSLAVNYAAPTRVEACVPVPDGQIGGRGAGSASDRVFNTAAHDARAQILYPAEELGNESRWLGALRFQITGAGSLPMRNFTLRLKHTDLTSLEGRGWEQDGWTTVFTGASIAAATEFFAFTTPFFYNGAGNLLLDVSFNNTTGGRAGTVRCTTIGNGLMLAAVSDSMHGSPLAWTTSYGPQPQLCLEVPVLEVYSVQNLGPIPASPVTTSRGTWTGSAFAPTAECRAMWLLAQAPSGIFAFSPRVTLAPGPSPAAAAGIVFADSFESGVLGPAWSIAGSSGAAARTRVTSEGLPKGKYHMVMDAASTAPDAAVRNSPTLTLDLLGRRNVTLEWRAKSFGDVPVFPVLSGPGGVFSAEAVFDGVAISADGVTWVEVAPLRQLAPAYPAAASRVLLDPIMQRLGWDYNGSFQIRFSQCGHSAMGSDGIGIDDIVVRANTANVIAVALPYAIVEGTGGIPVTVTLPTPATANTAVALVSDSPARLTVRSPITILAGQTTATTVVNAPQNQYLDMGKAVVVTATARGFVGAPSHIRVVDDERAVLSLTLPAAANEAGQPCFGMVGLSQMAAVPVQVFLDSSDRGRVDVSNTITIPFGAQAASFELAISAAGGSDMSGAPVRVTASGEGLLEASAIVDVGPGERPADQ